MVAGVGLLAATILAPVHVAANPSVSIRILFELGDGTYVWADETIEDPAVTNATWHAVERAAAANGIAMETAWHPDFGVGIFGLGGRHPPAGFIGLFLWNGTLDGWEYALAGISSLVLGEGDVIALSNAGFASVPPWNAKTPVPTPDHPRPATEFRGDAMNSGIAGSSIPDRVRVVWEQDTGSREVGSTPAIAFGKVFVETMNRLVAMDVETGAILWTNHRARGFSSPAIFNHSVYVGTSNGTVIRLQEGTGATIWETRLLETTNFTGISSSPKVVYDWLYIGTFNESGGNGEVVALWEGNGTVMWRHPTPSVHFSSPAVADGTVYVGAMGLYNTTSQISFQPPFGVFALDAMTGEERWFFPTGGSVAASPAVVGPNLIVPSKDGTVYAINRSTGALVWESPVDAGISSPAVFGGTVFVGGGSFGSPGRVVALDAADGSVRWSFEPNGPVQSSITYAMGKIVFATNTARGTVYAINAATGSAAWSFEPSPAEYILGSPVVADGIVYVPSDNGHVVALGEAPAESRPMTLGVVEIGSLIVAVAVVAGVVGFVLVRRRRPGP
jgi:outer membrane protein assembly factor BamB